MATDESYGTNGAFLVPLNHGTIIAVCIAAIGEGFEHVSVSLGNKKGGINRCPTWNEMCEIKDLFWDEDDCVMQLHPPQEDWISNHDYCLHLWRPIGQEIPRPHHSLVGIK